MDTYPKPNQIPVGGRPVTLTDDVSPRLLLAAGLIALAQRGNIKADRADAYRLTVGGHAALQDWQQATR